MRIYTRHREAGPMETAMLLAVLLTLLLCVTGASAQEELRAAFFNWTLDEYAHNKPGTEAGSWQTRMEKLRADGYNAVILMGHHFRWNILDRWPETVAALARLAEVAHSLGMRIYEHHSAALCSEDRIDQPVGDGQTVRDLLEIKADSGEPINCMYNAYWLCPNNPTYRAFYLDYVRDIFTAGCFDGFMCDDVEMLPDASVCACGFCARRFERLAGAELPAWGDDGFWFNEDSELWRRWVRARQTSVADFYHDVNALLQELVPGAPLFICQADPTGTLVTSRWALANDIFEPSVGIRFWEDWQGEKPDYRRIWRRAVLNLTYLDNLAGERKPVLDLFYTGTEEQTHLRWACDRVTGACTGTVEACPRGEYMGQFLQARPGPPVANVAIVHSASSRDYRTSKDHVQSFWAWGEALVDSGAGFAVLTEDQLTDVAKLASYRLVILPEVVCLSEQALATLNQAALAGVRVAYTPGSGAFDETGAPADRAALGAMPQVASLYRQIASAPESRRAMRELSRWAEVRRPAQVRGANSGYCRLYDAGDGRYQLRIMQYSRTPNRRWRIVLPELSITAARLRGPGKVELDLEVQGGSALVPEGTVTGYCEVDLLCASRAPGPNRRARDKGEQPMLPIALAAVTLPNALLAAVPDEIVCEGIYPGHLQGVATNGVDAIYWSFTTVVVKTDLQGKITARVEGPTHHGDCCWAEGKLHVAWSNQFNAPGADSKVYIYDGETLALERVVPVPEVTFGAGGMDYCDGHFFIISGLPKDYEENYVYEYDGEYKYIKTHVLPSGYTNLGIQTACFHDDCWWFGCYTVEGKKGLLKADRDMKLLGIHDVSPAIGLIGWGDGRFLMAKHFGDKWQAKLVPIVADEKVGLAPAR